MDKTRFQFRLFSGQIGNVQCYKFVVLDGKLAIVCSQDIAIE